MLETGTSFALGLVINYFLVIAAMKMIEDRAVAAWVSVMLCSVHSLVRGYVLRRWFAHREAS